MPSPFPGMDPYLENPGLWPDVHHEIISEARALLSEQLRPKYAVRVEERVYISDDNDPGRSAIIPDLQITTRHEREERTDYRTGPGGVSVIEPVEATLLIDDEIHEARLEIIDRERHAVVTVIEVLSPSNKVEGSVGRRSFERKRQDILESPTHWVAIDLLRVGVGVRTRETLPPHEYLVHVSRARRHPRGRFWPIRLPQRLPTIPIPLKGGDPDAPLDLQAVLDTAYDRAGYDLSVDYTRDPTPPLPEEWAAWADGLLKARGLRPA
jgi:hypothetical protein